MYGQTNQIRHARTTCTGRLPAAAVVPAPPPPVPAVVVDAAALTSDPARPRFVAVCRRALRDTMEAEQDVSNKLKALSKKAQRLRGELRDAQDHTR